MIDISIVIPVFNGERFLEKCVESIFENVASTNFFEVLIIDDGSVDKTQLIAQNLCNKYCNIKYFNNKNQGVSKTRNFGLKEAKGKYIYFYDVDDWVEPRFVEKALKLVNTNVDIICFSYKEIYKSGLITVKKFDTDKKMNKKEFFDNFYTIFKTDMLYTVWNKLYKKSFLKKYHLEFSNRKIGEDTIFNLMTYNLINDIYLSESVLYNYNMNIDNSAMNSLEISDIKSQVEEIKILEEFLIRNNINNKKFLEFLYEKFLINSCSRVALKHSNQDSKKKDIFEIKNIHEIQLLLSSKYISEKNKIDYFLLKHNLLNIFILSKKIKNLLKSVIK